MSTLRGQRDSYGNFINFKIYDPNLSKALEGDYDSFINFKIFVVLTYMEGAQRGRRYPCIYVFIESECA